MLGPLLAKLLEMTGAGCHHTNALRWIVSDGLRLTSWQTRQR